MVFRALALYFVALALPTTAFGEGMKLTFPAFPHVDVTGVIFSERPQSAGVVLWITFALICRAPMVNPGLPGLLT